MPVFDPLCLGEHINVRFNVRRLAHAKLVWLNERWLIESGMDPYDTVARDAFVAQILHNFAVQADANGCDEDWLEADRYGGTDGAIHGGSGRCASRDGYIAKGIGKTPLVSEVADNFHRNGLMSLAEAFKEAVCAEIANRELPWGSIPVVAIIDAGFDYPPPDGGKSRRAAIMVRPVFVRPAHFERSIYFGSAGFAGSAQFLDAARVRNAIHTLSENPTRYPTLCQMFRRFAQQLGAGRALRLWQGRFLTSNISIDGALLDFGAYRSLPNWNMAVGLQGECFGAEMNQLKHAFLSVAAYFSKYNGYFEPDHGGIRGYLDELQIVEREAFLDTCFGALGVVRDDRTVVKRISELLTTCYRLQQTWKTDIIKPSQRPNGRPRVLSMNEQRSVHLISEIIRLADEEVGNRSGHSRAAEFFQPRSILKYESLDRRTRRIERIATTENLPAEKASAAFIDRHIMKGCMWNVLLPRSVVALAVAANTYSAVVRCKKFATDTQVYWVRAACQGGHVFVLGQKIPMDEIRRYGITADAQSVSFEVPVSHFTSEELRIGTRRLQPKFYAVPSAGGADE